MQRLARIAGSFAIVLVAYWVYAHTAVPLIEPPIRDIEKPERGGDDGGPTLPSRTGNDFYVKEIQGLFKPGDWQINAQNPPMIIEVNNRAKLLMQNYKTQPDGRIFMSPCTVVFLYDGPAENEEERLRRSIVLEAPDGAVVKFDSPLDPQKLKFGRPIGGELMGNITIRSGGKLACPEDDLLIKARSVAWNNQDATSEYPVEFCWGKNRGKGSGLHIKLAARAPNSPGMENGPNVSGIELFELRKIESLHLEGDPNAPKNDETATSSQTPPAADQMPWGSTNQVGQIDITCSGPFRFDLLKRVASFEDGVEVLQTTPNEPAEQLLCDKLSMYLATRNKNQNANDSSNSDLEPQRFEALGKPARLTAPNASPDKCVSAQGERLSYDMTSKLIELDGGPEVSLQQGENEIHGKSLKYQQPRSKAPNALGIAQVKGPGWMRGTASDRRDQKFNARWNGELNLSPKEGYQVISLTGGTVLDYTSLGKLSADTIYFWFLETASADPTKRPPLKPVKMLARSNVILDMTSAPSGNAQPTHVSGSVNEMAVWFEQKDAPNGIRVETREKAGDGYPGMGDGPRLDQPSPSGENSGANSRATDRTPQSGDNPPGTIIPISYSRQQSLQRTAFRQPFPGMPQPTTGRQPLAVVRPMESAPANPNLPPIQNHGVVTNPYLSGQPNSNPPLPVEQGQNESGNIPSIGREQRFTISGNTLKAKVVLGDSQAKPELSNLIIEGNVKLEETQTREPGEKPLLIKGDQVEVNNLGAINAVSPTPNYAPDAMQYKITVLGRPASVEGHGMSLVSTNIGLDRRLNQLSIKGPGSMGLPMPGQINGQTLAAQGVLTVTWKQGMNFDGRKATFEQDVEASSPGRHLQTRTLVVTLQQPIDFGNPELQNRNQNNVAQISCDGGVFLESNEFDEKNQRTYVRMTVKDMLFDVQSGTITAGGPGWLNSVRQDDSVTQENNRGIFLPIHAAAPPSGSAISPVVQPQPAFPLMGMHVRFQGAITGNLNPNNQRIIFNDRVRMLYAPVEDWAAMLNPDKTEPLGSNEFMLKCDNLDIRHAIHPTTKEQATEMDAQGNSVVQGMISNAKIKDVMYTARAMRISYNTLKDQLILEGDGRSDVHLYRQLQLGAPWDDMAMKKIIFYLKTNTISSEGIQSLQINQLSR